MDEALPSPFHCLCQKFLKKFATCTSTGRISSAHVHIHIYDRAHVYKYSDTKGYETCARSGVDGCIHRLARTCAKRRVVQLFFFFDEIFLFWPREQKNAHMSMCLGGTFSHRTPSRYKLLVYRTVVVCENFIMKC
jgi:hypothetical protein